MIKGLSAKLPQFFQKIPAGLLFGLLVVLGVLGYLLLGYFTLRTNFTQLISLFCALFGLYGLVLVWPWSQRYLQAWIGAAVGFRLLLLLVVPNLSDDYARFVWDGRLLAHGFNPYLYLPASLLNSPVLAQAGLNKALFDLLNSPQYFTVYPPLNQAFFGLAAWLSGQNLLLNIVFLRGFILVAELGTCWLLYSPKNPRRVLIYALNPLVIIELTSNLHFEAVVIFFLILAFRWLQTRPVLSAGALALAIGTKLLPLLFLPLIVGQLGWRRAVVYCATLGLGIALLFWPFLSVELFQNMGKSLDLYFQKFEFNASLYYLARAIGFWYKGYNVIQTLGPALSLLAGLGIVWIGFSRWVGFGQNFQGLTSRALLSLLIYFLAATTVHPWYITTLVALCGFTVFRFPVVWSALLPLTYAAYAAVPFRENPWFLVLEYGILSIFVALEWGYLPKVTSAK